MTSSKIHQSDPNMAPDADFLPGDIELLCEGNACRLLDARRTPGRIEKLMDECAMFRWRITAFEHAGRFWEVPAEDVVDYQFAKGAARLAPDRVRTLRAAIWEFQLPLVVEASQETLGETQSAISLAQDEVKAWMVAESEFLRNGEKLSLGSRVGSVSLARDLTKYMASLGLGEIERKTAEAVVLNPNSGEWVKGMEIVLGEMGLVRYESKVPRTKDIFSGLGAKESRRRYLLRRLAFVRAYFGLIGMDEVALYRGAGVEGCRVRTAGSFTSYTFDLRVARSFCDFDRVSKFRHSYLLKTTLPVDRLFMTYLETAAMNESYREAEALALRAEGGEVSL
jgi:hypothetical protein